MQVKKFNWVRQPTAWESLQAWKAKRQAMMQDFQSDSATASQAFADAQNNLSSGLATLAAQTSLASSQQQIAAAKDALTSATSSVDTSASTTTTSSDSTSTANSVDMTVSRFRLPAWRS